MVRRTLFALVLGLRREFRETSLDEIHGLAGEQLVEHLMELTGGEEQQREDEGSDWLWDTYTLR